jgi:hypothetical protein
MTRPDLGESSRRHRGGIEARLELLLSGAIEGHELGLGAKRGGLESASVTRARLWGLTIGPFGLFTSLFDIPILCVKV